MLVISADRRLRQADPEFEASLSYIVRSCLIKQVYSYIVVLVIHLVPGVGVAWEEKGHLCVLRLHFRLYLHEESQGGLATCPRAQSKVPELRFLFLFSLLCTGKITVRRIALFCCWVYVLLIKLSSSH
jgi:hypothetical protein